MLFIRIYALLIVHNMGFRSLSTWERTKSHHTKHTQSVPLCRHTVCHKSVTSRLPREQQLPHCPGARATSVHSMAPNKMTKVSAPDEEGAPNMAPQSAPPSGPPSGPESAPRSGTAVGNGGAAVAGSPPQEPGSSAGPQSAPCSDQAAPKAAAGPRTPRCFGQ